MISSKHGRATRIVLALALVVTLALALGVAPASAARKRSHPFVGKVAGSNAYIGIQLRKKKAFIYVCDGVKKTRRQTIGEWFPSKRSGNTITGHSSHGATLTATINGKKITGSITLADGRQLSFIARRKKRKKVRFLIARLPSSKHAKRPPGGRLNKGKFLAGWIRLSDGTERGTVRSRLHCFGLLLKIKRYDVKVDLGFSTSQEEWDNYIGDTTEYRDDCS